MKTNNTLKTILAALLLGAGLSGANAASLLADGDFDSLPVGTAPDVGTPAGHWFWPANYLIDAEYLGERAAAQFSIVPAPGGGSGNCLLRSFTATEWTGSTVALPNLLARSVTKASGEILHVSFDIYVAPGRGGGAVNLGKGFVFEDRGPQLAWLATGELIARTAGGGITSLISSYPRGVWQTVRLEVDVAHDRYNFYWGEKGQPASVIRFNLTFLAGTIPYIDRLNIIRYNLDESRRDVHSYIDNIRVSAGEPAAVVPGQSFALPGGSVTLSLTNTLNVPSTYQWQFNGTNLPGATGSTLALSNVTTNHSGLYRVALSNAFEVVTTAPALVHVVNQLMLIAHPQSTNAPAGSNVTLSVAAISPLPISYQWQINGVDLPGQTSSTLALTNMQLAQDGLYTVVATDALRSVVSQPAALRILIKPVIVQTPLSQSVVAGGSVTVSVEITGNPAPFLYQWRKGSIILTNVVQAGRKAFLTLNNVQPSQAGTYRVIVTNAASTTLNVTTTCILTVLPDTDGDGLPDAWETAHGLSSVEATDALLDSDGDGHSNLAEYRSGTNPTNAASCLKLEGIAQANGTATVSFNAVSNQTYTVEWCAQPDGGAWTKLTDLIARPNNRTETVTDSTASDAARFYRVITPRQP